MDSKKLKLLAKLATSALAVNAVGLGAQVSAMEGGPTEQYKLDGRSAEFLQDWENDENVDIPDNEPDLQKADRYVDNLVQYGNIKDLQSDNVYLLGAIADNLADALDHEMNGNDTSPLGALNINLMRRLYLHASRQNDSLEERLRVKLLEDTQKLPAPLNHIQPKYPARKQEELLRLIGRVAKRYKVGTMWQAVRNAGWEVKDTIQ